MNNLLDALQPYPFQRLNGLLENVQPQSGKSPISWAMGEPKHPAPDFLVAMLNDESLIREGFGTYPPTKGRPELRNAISSFLAHRFRLNEKPDPELQVLPVSGTREALFSFAQAVVEPTDDSVTMMPNPFYQIYEGAAILAGSKPYFLNCTAENGFIPDFSGVSNDLWQACQLIYICTPGNPTGAVQNLQSLEQLISLSLEHDFVIASDECYSELYADEANPPPGILQAAQAVGNPEYRNCIAFNSLSKRSNLPGLRSGYVAGDAALIEKFLLYRTYHGAAMPVHHQVISTLAWSDEQHVIDNRATYRLKFARVTEILSTCWTTAIPAAGFYLWPETPIPDQDFAVRLIQETNVKVLPGSLLSRDTNQGNPGANRVRIALVATETECIEAAERIVNQWQRLIR